MSSSTSSSDGDLEMNRRLRRFVLRFVVFISPLLSLWLPLEWFLWKTGESIPAATVIEMQSQADHEVLYGRGLLNQQFNAYKVAGWQKFEPKIVCAGSSRVWRLRKEAFHPREADVYNAGGLLQCADDFREMVDMIVDGRLPKPEAILVGFDPWWFKANHLDRTWLDSSSLIDDAYRLPARINVAKRLLADPSFLISPDTDNSSSHIGVFGRIGFRLDGSMKVSDEVIRAFAEKPVYVDRESPPVIQRIQQRTGRFSPSTFDREVMQETLASAQRLRDEGVFFIAFFPPFATESWAAIHRSEEIMQWMQRYIDEVIPAISDVANATIELGDSASLGVDDTYFLDGMHSGEVLATLQWVELVERHQDVPFFRQFAQQHIREQLEQRCSTPLAYD